LVGRRDAAIAAGYAAYFGAIGVFQPFFPVHLAALGFGAIDIGIALAAWNALRIVSPLGIAWLADAQADRRPLLAGFAFAAVLASLGLLAATSLAGVVLGMAALSLCLNGLMPVYDAHTLETLGTEAHRYGRLRLFGSIGFVASSVGVGALIARDGATVIRPAFVGLLFLTALVVLALPPPGTGVRLRPLRGEFRAALRRPAVGLLVLIVFLQIAGFGGYYGFYSLYLARAGYAPDTIGLFWAVGVIAEIALFAVVPRLLTRVAPTRLLQWALAGSVLRWLVIAAWPGVPALLLGAQVLHFAGFGLFHAVTVQLGPSLLPAGSAARAQALLSSLGWGAGGMAGSLLAGELWEAVGPRTVFLAGAALAAMAWWVAARRLPRAISGAREAPCAGG
jgi:PPP family 3-phenylpropionic acid transporter